LRRTPIATLEFDNLSLLPLLYGEHNSHLHHLEKTLNIQIADRGNNLSLSGAPENVALADNVLRWMWGAVNRSRHVGLPEIDAAIRFARDEKNDTQKQKKSNAHGGKDHPVILPQHEQGSVTTRRKTLMARTQNQRLYVEALRHHEMTFGIGPAGTGKTYLAVAVGVEMFERELVDRLVFCRPAVEAGEKLGFLPGDMRDKIDPYLRPIYDGLYDFLGAERVEKMLERGEIEIAPLAFMRGRTLSRAYVVLDEAQNTTSAQMKMFLSRMGDQSRMVITGDPSQTDLPSNQTSGLQEALRFLKPIREISFIEFQNSDIVRHHLVGKILQAYDDHKK
jgi:phosphate starvation-inducible protein PhoH and related proteins